MYCLRRLSLFIALAISGSTAAAQKFGGSPPSVHWEQINTPLSRIIFQKGMDSTAARVANIISFIQKPNQKSIGNKTKKINIVFQNQTSISNGYVGLSPFRSEFFLTPPPNSFDLGSLPWPELLAIHEYRHVEQYNNFNVGVSKVLRTLFGEGGQAIANGAAIPDWFFEGDAVFNETNLTMQGRGSLPSFYNGFRSIWNEGKSYNWMQLRNGSYKNYLPNHYPLGYMLVAYGREKYGEEFWKNVTREAASYKTLFYPFQHALKKHSGISFKTFREDALDFFKNNLNPEESSQVNKQKKERFKDEQYPSITEEGSTIYIRKSYDKIPAFILKKEGQPETVLRIADYTIDSYFSYRKNKIAYASFRPDLRWGNRDYNEIKVLDISSGKQQTVTHKSRYFSPDISFDGASIIAVFEDTFNNQKLRIIDIETGKIINESDNPEGLVYANPKFSSFNKVISAVRNKEGKMSLLEIDIPNNHTSFLLPFTYNVIGFPVMKNDTIFFSCSYLKKDELFAFTSLNKKIWKVSVPAFIENKGFGKYHPAVSDDRLSWHTLTAYGNKIISVPKNQLSFAEISEDAFTRPPSHFGISVLDNNTSPLLSKVPADTLLTTKYRKSFQLFNFHSLFPEANDPDYTLTLQGENILSTFQSELSFSYNRAEKYKRAGFAATYSALFPFLTGGLNVTWDRQIIRNGKKVSFNQWEPFAGVQVPLNLSRGRSFTFLTMSSQYIYNTSNFTGIYKDSFPDNSYGYLNSYLSLSHQVQKAQQQIFPRFAQSAVIRYKEAVNNYTGSQVMINGNLYFPGFLRNHSIVINGAWLRKDSLRQINFTGNFPFSRGYEATSFHKMYKWGINYHFPIAYPDQGFANILFLLRVRSNIFFDNTDIYDFNKNRQGYKARFRSAGTEITFDTKWWNQVQVSFGFRYSYLLDKDLFGNTNSHRWEIMMPVNIFNQ